MRARACSFEEPRLTLSSPFPPRVRATFSSACGSAPSWCTFVCAWFVWREGARREQPAPPRRPDTAAMSSPLTSGITEGLRDTYPHAADQYELHQPIGRGASAIVFRAICLTNQKEVAVKIIDLENCPAEIDDIRREIVQMRLCSHPNVVKSHCSFVHGPYLWLVMDFHAGGSVLDIMKYSRPEGLADEALIATILKDALQGIVYLHSTGQIHRDVKAGNLLVSRDGRVLIADFGVSALLMESGAKRKSMSFVGTPCWMAPEVMEQVVGYDFKADIWSFGITALELANGTAPLASYPPMKVLLMTLQNPPPSLQGAYSKSLKDLVEQCLQKDPSKRPTASKLMEHKFFKAAKKHDYVVKELLQKLPLLWERLKVTANSDEDLEARKREILQLDKSQESEAWSFGETLRQKLDVAALRSEAERQEQQEQDGGVERSTPIPVPSSSAPAATEATTKGRFSVTSSTAAEVPAAIPSAATAAAGGAKDSSASIKETKGRFQVSRPSGATAAQKLSSTSQGSNIKDDAGDPLKLLTQLGTAVRRLQEENDRLRQENRDLKRQLGEREGAGAS